MLCLGWLQILLRDLNSVSAVYCSFILLLFIDPNKKPPNKQTRKSKNHFSYLLILIYFNFKFILFKGAKDFKMITKKATIM